MVILRIFQMASFNGAMIPSGGAPVVLSEGDMLAIGDVNLRVLIDE